MSDTAQTLPEKLAREIAPGNDPCIGPGALIAPATSPEAKAALIEAWHSAEATDRPSLVQPAPTIETTDQRRERLIEVAARAQFDQREDGAADWASPGQREYHRGEVTPIIDAVIASDRAVGRDPEALRAEVERLRAEYDTVRIPCLQDALAASVAREAIAVRALKTARDEAFRANGNVLHLKRCVAVQLNAAVANLSPAAEAMLRVVGATRRFLREDGSANRFGAEANKALDALDALTGEADHG